MRLIGIDPGVSGAVVVMDELYRLIEWTRMPVIKIGASSRVNSAELAAFLRNSTDRAASVLIERVGAAPIKGRRQGGSSMFTFGHAAGVAEGVVATLGLSLTLVTPQSWKRSSGLIGTDKDAARARAIQLWPNWRDLDKKGAGQALADAALIARFGG
jgi:crossover junction endodeoxyribonuclease RuvC